MKKKIISLLLVLSAFLITSGVSAKEMSKDDIKPGTYMIGTHLFTRVTAGEYDGTLTVRYIMLAARTINSANIDDMIIYLKNSRGKWVNAVTNEEVTVPDKVDIYYQNANTLTEVQYGDVNGDGRVNTADTILIRQYLSGVEIPKDANILNGDVNDDGKITEADVILLDKYVANSYPDKNLPNESLGKSYPIEYIVDSETYKVDYELNGKALRTSQKPVEPTRVGYKFVGWYLDSEYKTEYKFDVMPITEYTVLYAKFDKLQYGDVNGDGKVNFTDVTVISRYLAGYELPSNSNILNGDVNDDGKITEADVVLLRKYLSGSYSDKNLPNESLGKSYPIEYIVDNETYKIDYELTGRTLLSSQKPEEPTRVGYKFVGWYLDSEYKTEYKFDNMPITEYTVLYAKFDKLQYGDVNGDGKVNYTDVTAISRYLAGYELPLGFSILNGDVNADGIIDYADVQILRYYIVNANAFELPYTSATKYTISYDLNNGYFDKYSPEEYVSNFGDITLSNPIRDGYKFLGWTGSNGDTPQLEVVISEETTGNLNYVANWVLISDIPVAPTLTLKSDSWTKSGVRKGVISFCESGAYSSKKKPSGAELYEKINEKYVLIDEVNINDLTNECWFDFELNPGEEKVYVIKVYVLDTNSNKIYSDYSDELIQKNDNVITYNLDGGVNSPNNLTWYSRGFEQKLEAPTKEGYKFIGWTGSNGDTPQLEVVIPSGTTGNLSYTANWEQAE